MLKTFSSDSSLFDDMVSRHSSPLSAVHHIEIPPDYTPPVSPQVPSLSVPILTFSNLRKTSLNPSSASPPIASEAHPPPADYPASPPGMLITSKDYPASPPGMLITSKDYPASPPGMLIVSKDYSASPPQMFTSAKDYSLATTPPPEMLTSKGSIGSIDYPPPPTEAEMVSISATRLATPPNMVTASNLLIASNIVTASNTSLSTLSSHNSRQEDERTEADQKSQLPEEFFQRERKLSHYENWPPPASPKEMADIDQHDPYYFPEPPDELTTPKALDERAFMARNVSEGYPVVTQANSDSEGGERDQWGSYCQYFLTSLGLAVGLGNIWRFPYVCYENGGSTFMIPYVMMLLLIGLPLFFMEMVLGQYAGLSATKIFARLAPGLKGLGYGMLSVPILVSFYYTVIMAWSFFFMFSGFTADLPWKNCGKEYNSLTCFSLEDFQACPDNTTFWNNTCTPIHQFCEKHSLTSNHQNPAHCFHPNSNFAIQPANVARRVSAAEDFFMKRMLGIGEIGVESTWTKFGGLRWELLGCLALSWAIVCLCLIKGIHSYGKVVYFITLFPFVVLVTLLIYVSFHDGFTKGVEFYILNPDWSRLATDINVWKNAAAQVFYSLGVAAGSQLLLSSYNKFDSNCHRDAILIGVCNSLTSVFGGFVVFGTLGTLAHKNQVEIKDVVTSGTSLVFVAYPEAIAHLTAAPFFSFIFFLMLCLLALSSIAGGVETTIAAILDEFPVLRIYRHYVVVLCCLISFLGGVSCCCNSGLLMFNLLDQRCSQCVVIIGLLEITVLYFYGNNRFVDNIMEMKICMPRPVAWYWKICWGFITPTLLIAILILSWIAKEEDHYNDYTYPPIIQLTGWLIELFPLMIVVSVSVGVVMYNLLNHRDTSFIQAGPLLCPTAAWGPRDDRDKDMDLGRINLSYYLDVQLSNDIKTEL